METLLSVLIATLVTLFFVRGYVKTLASKALRSAAAAPPPAAGVPCPRCQKPVMNGSAFCAACGAPMALWSLHRAVVKEAGGDTGVSAKPKPVINATLCIGCGSCIEACPEEGTLALVGGKAILAHQERCLGHSDCVGACPTSAIVLSVGGLLQTLRVPCVNENFETNLPGIYIVGELGGMGLIKTAINEGKVVIEHLRRRLEQAGLWNPPEFDPHTAANDKAVVEVPPADQLYDVVIAGAGPAGLSASLTAHQHGLKYLTLEQGEVAATIRNYPRHKFLMAEPLEMPLIGSLYIGDSTKEALLSVWETILKNTGVRVRTNERVEAIVREPEGFSVRSSGGEYRARFVVLALGKRGTPRMLGVQGEERNKVAYKLIEADTYVDADILIIGGGDSAVEAALAVAQSGKNRVTLSYRGPEFTRIKDRNQQRMSKAETEGRIRVLRSSEIREIRSETVTLEVRGEPLEIPNRYVFVLIGGESPEDFLRKVGVDIVEKVLTNDSLGAAERVLA
jgi:thioredoxin reductase